MKPIYHKIISNIGVSSIFSPNSNMVGRGAKKFLKALLDTTLQVMRHSKARKMRRRNRKKI